MRAKPIISEILVNESLFCFSIPTNLMTEVSSPFSNQLKRTSLSMLNSCGNFLRQDTEPNIYLNMTGLDSRSYTSDMNFNFILLMINDYINYIMKKINKEYFLFKKIILILLCAKPYNRCHCKKHRNLQRIFMKLYLSQTDNICF